MNRFITLSSYLFEMIFFLFTSYENALIDCEEDAGLFFEPILLVKSSIFVTVMLCKIMKFQ